MATHQVTSIVTLLKTRVYPLLFRTWQFLTEPSPALLTLQERQQARMLAAIHLPVPLIFLVLWVTRGYGYTLNVSAISGMAVVLMISIIISYGLSRSRHYRLGAYCMIAAIGGVVVAAALFDTNVMTLRIMPVYFAHVVILASLFLSMPMTFFIALLSVVGLAWYGTTLGELQAQVVASDLRYLVTLYILILISTLVRTYYESQIARNALIVRESEMRYRTLFEETFEPMLIHNKGYVVAVNPAMEKVSGFSNEALTGQHLLNFIHPESRDMLLGEAVAVTQGLEVTLQKPDGHAVPAQLFTKPILYHGTEMRMVSVRDLTQQRLAEAARLENAVAQDRQTMLQKLIRNLSHDFRTPLAVIKTSLYMLERSTHEPARHQKHLEVVRLQTNRLQEMMDDFITLARLDYVRKSDLTVESVDIDQIIRGVIADQKPLAEKRKVEVVYRGCDDQIRRSVDKEALQRIAKSLISNAILYTPPEGRVEVVLRVDDQSLLLSVLDTGVGISPDEMPHIYEPFYRGDPTRSTETGGAGLGLTIARRLTDMLGGTLTVQSEVGVGSNFRVTLPLNQTDSSDEDEASPLLESLA